MRRAIIDLDAIRGNVRALRAAVGGARSMVVVKANGYGHGAVPVAQAALEAGADWLGVVDLTEALALRAAGIRAPILAWLHDPDSDLAPAVEHGIDLGVSSLRQLEVAAGANVHLKVDTGLGRSGAAPSEWAALFEEAAVAQRSGRIRVRGLWSHLAGADDAAQVAAFENAVSAARAAGLEPELLHLAASDAALRLPDARFGLVRFGIAAYGLGGEFGLPLRPAMTLEATVVSAKRVAAGTGVSYGHDYVTPRETTLALVPLGYGDGVPRHASGRGPVRIGERVYRVAGRVAMDQLVVDVGDDPVTEGDRAVLFGDAAAGNPTAGDWAEAADTIDYEIVTRIGPRVQRVYVGHGSRPPVPARSDVTAVWRGNVATPEAMAELGARIAAELRAGDLVLLNGELGAGKTTLTRGIGAALGVRGAVTSPTFVLARTHPRVDGPPLVHVDAYRLSSALELDDLDIDFEASIVVVEWGKGLLEHVTTDWLEVDIERPHGMEHLNSADAAAEVEPREVTLTGHGPRWKEWVDAAGH